MTLADKIKKMCEWDDEELSRFITSDLPWEHSSYDALKALRDRLRPILELMPQILDTLELYAENDHWIRDNFHIGKKVLEKLELIAESEGVSETPVAKASGWVFKDACKRCRCEWTLSIPPFEHAPKALNFYYLPCPSCGASPNTESSEENK